MEEGIVLKILAFQEKIIKEGLVPQVLQACQEQIIGEERVFKVQAGQEQIIEERIPKILACQEKITHDR